VSPHLVRSLQAIRAAGMKSGVALNPGTPVECIFDALEYADLVLVMTVNPGWGGQSFLHSSLSKIERLKEFMIRQKLDLLIEVDGGINATTAGQCVRAGASVLVAGSYVFGASDRKAQIQSLKEASH